MVKSNVTMCQFDDRHLGLSLKNWISDYVRIYEENMMVRMASNDAAETLVLLSEMGKSANVTLRGVNEENEKDEKDYEMEQEM
ncbi:hypothetical protein C1645_819574 [Glomus cerebriforme]|uniref:Uncharacterized protein n=1 Tax=Glomus cerebriforme TaxID=658196 RepID=A0A397TEF1_9GLOM|nr:hypothetical protein C1645_819574 [Glomus cerebriforme]